MIRQLHEEVKSAPLATHRQRADHPAVVINDLKEGLAPGLVEG